MSKELEALEIVRKELIKCHRLPNETRYDELDIIETALKEHELMKEIRITARFDLAQVNKEHKALEIIKNKRVDVGLLLANSFDTYNQLIFVQERQLIEEEYELLKEILK